MAYTFISPTPHRVATIIKIERHPGTKHFGSSSRDSASLNHLRTIQRVIVIEAKSIRSMIVRLLLYTQTIQKHSAHFCRSK